jgi:hypothetical protein
MSKECVPFLDFNTVAVIDSNVALECLAFEQLPWGEIDRVGPIALLITPTVLREVDGMKHHARLADHARRFNRLVSPAAVSGSSVVIREANPRVELQLGTYKKILWDDFHDLDKEEPDSRIIAEALHCQDFDKARMVVVSHDIRPLGLARSNGLRAFHIKDEWLRPKEISPAEKKVKQLDKRIAELEASEPILELAIDCEIEQPVEVYWVEELTENESNEIECKIIDGHSMKLIEENPLIFGGSRKYEYERSYEEYERKSVPSFVSQYARKIELAFGQFPITVRFSNSGSVRADSFVLKIAVVGGWINDKFVFASPTGPIPPSPKSGLEMPVSLQNMRPRHQIGRHQVELVESPKRCATVTLNCEDFRHRVADSFQCVVWCDPRGGDQLIITAIATAANLHGEIRTELKINKLVRRAQIDELLNLQNLKFKKPPPLVDVLSIATKNNNFSNIEWEK